MSKAQGLRVLAGINNFRAIFKQAPLDITNKQQILDYIEGQLSPENLSCDGEASLAQVKQTRREMAALRLLVDDSGPKPDPEFKKGDDINFQGKKYTIVKVNKVNYVVKDDSGKTYNLKISAHITIWFKLV